MPPPRIALAQISTQTDPEQNYQTIATLAAKAISHHQATLFCLPECFDYLTPQNISHTLSQPLSSPYLTRYQSLSTHHNLWLSLGGFHERHPTLPETKFYNTHLILSPTSQTPVAIYRKTHLFDAVLPSGNHISEQSTTAPGTILSVARNTPFGTIGLSTCYDLRFPALYEALRKAGAHLLLVPSAFFPTTGAAHWHTLLRARAIENQCYVAAAAQVGRHFRANRVSYGHSLIVDPFGKVLADAGPTESNLVVSADFSSSNLDDVRQRMPVISHRRDDLLGTVIDISPEPTV